MIISLSHVLAAMSLLGTPPDGLWVDSSEGRMIVKSTFFGRQRLTNEQLAWICEQPRIDHLDLTGANVTERPLEAICRAVKLGGICLSFNQLDSKALSVIAHANEIREVRLMDSGICPNDLSPLRKCKNMHVLSIGDDTRECRLDTVTLTKLESLRKLVIMAKSISNEEIEKLGSLGNLSTLVLFLVETPDNIGDMIRVQLPSTDVQIIPLKAGPFTWPRQRRNVGKKDQPPQDSTVPAGTEPQDSRGA